MRQWLWLSWFLGFSALALNTAYVTFDHPEGWQCELSQGVWICQSNQAVDRKESVVLSIAAQATKWDSLDNYEKYLKKPRRIQDDKGEAITSKIVYTRKRVINGHTWVDSLQQNSELPGFWARYLSTVHQTKSGRLAILITYIVSNERYKKLAPLFERMVSSLKPRADFDANIASKQGDQILPGSTVLGKVQQNIVERLRPPGQAAPPDVALDVGKENNTWIMLLLAVIVVVYLYTRRRRALKEKLKGKKLPPTEDT